MSEQKRFPLSEIKREKLRKSGVMPISKELVCLGVLVGVSISTSIVLSMSEGSLFKGLFQVRNLKENQELYLILSGISLIPTLFCLLLLYLLQTKFGFHFPGFKNGIVGFSFLFKPRFFLTNMKILYLLAFLLAVYLWVNFLFEEVFSYALFGRVFDDLDVFTKLNEKFNAFFVPLGGITLFLVFFVGIISFIATKLSFEKEHMMTRQEVEDEAREYESSDDIRQAIRERS